MKRQKLLVRSVAFIIALTTLAAQTGAVFAVSTTQKKAFSGGAIYSNTEDSPVGCSQAGTVATQNITPTGNKVFFIGDSLTVGMTSSGGLLDKAGPAGYSVSTAFTSTSNPSRVSGPSVEATTGINSTNTISKLADHANIAGDTLATADRIVIGLGTNPETNFETKITSLVSAIRGINANAQLFWINTYYTGSSRSIDYTEINTAIQNASTSNGQQVYTIIDLASAIQAGTAPAPDAGDGVHYNGSSYATRASFIISQLGNTATPAEATVSNCSCSPNSPTSLVGNDNMQKVFNFFVGKGYSPAQAAGIVGNMMNESGVEPMRLQGTKPGVETPSSTLGSNMTNPNIGWGLVQWTPPNKMAGLSFAAGTPYETIDTIEYQVDFLWKQLEGTLTGPLSSSNEKGAGTKLKTATTVEDAAVFFAGYYERFKNSGTVTNGTRTLDLSNPEYTKRINSAKDVLGIYGAGVTSAPANSALRPGGCGKISTTGYAFPLEMPAAGVSIEGITTGQTTTMHHDGTAAFDISYPEVTGKNVYALYDGVIDKVTAVEDNWCYSIQLKANDSFYYWYGHLIDVSVTDGQVVKAGDQIAKIATWTPDHTCNGTSTGAHLHIDRGCTLNGVPQRGGGDNCRDEAFIPLLSAVFEELRNK